MTTVKIGKDRNGMHINVSTEDRVTIFADEIVVNTFSKTNADVLIYQNGVAVGIVKELDPSDIHIDTNELKHRRVYSDISMIDIYNAIMW